jgi:uncharacterized protein (TIGR00269 family)
MAGSSSRKEISRCALCGKPAVFFERQAKRHLCGTHLIAGIEERVKKTVAERNLIVPGDTVAVGVSGGKDSTALLMILSRIVPVIPDVRLVAITVDEGIDGYREETVQAADRLVRGCGIEHCHVSFKDLYGDTLDTFLAGRESRACTVCGILRKKALADTAATMGATKLATGHNLDDEAQSVLMNVLRGDLLRLVRDSSTDSSGRFIPRIKPLMYVAEKEVAAFLLLQDAWPDLPECPYAKFALRQDSRTMLGTLEYRHPGTMLRLMVCKETIEKSCAGQIDADPLRSCRVCGEPCSGELCQFCQLRPSLLR